MELIYSKIKNAKNILLVSHVNPDADALASLACFIDLVEGLNKPYLALAENLDVNLFSFLPHIEKIVGQIPADFSVSKFDLMIVLDCGALRRTKLFDNVAELKKVSPRPFIIEFDHHPRLDDYADIEVRSPELSSTAELIYNFYKENNLEINKSVANALLAGLLADTGNFLYPATSSQVVAISAELLDRGASFPRIISRSSNKSLEELRLHGLALKKLKINKTDNIAYSIITKQEMADIFGAEDEDVQHEVFGDIAAMLSNLSGVKAVLLLSEKDNEYKVNIRSANKQINVSRLAQIFKGGGHPQASGFSVGVRPHF